MLWIVDLETLKPLEISVYPLPYLYVSSLFIQSFLSAFHAMVAKWIG